MSRPHPILHLRNLLSTELRKAVLVTDDKKDHVEQLPRKAVLCLEGSNVWKKYKDESREQGTSYVPLVKKWFGIGRDSQVFGYYVSRKANKEFIHRMERLIADNPSHFDASENSPEKLFVEDYFAPLLKDKNGQRPDAEALARDMRLSLVIHSYNEFPDMVENALRDRLKKEGFNDEEQKRILGQVFVLEAGTNYRVKEEPGFQRIQILGVNDDRCHGQEYARAESVKGKMLWGDILHVDAEHSAAFVDSSGKPVVLVKTPDTINGERNPHGHSFDGYIEALPPPILQAACEAMAVDTLPPISELIKTPSETPGAASLDWRLAIQPRATRQRPSSPTP